MTLSQTTFWLQLFLALNFIWFGTLKFFPGMSPAEDLATATIAVLTLDLIPATVSIKLLAIWEVAVGLGFLLGQRWIFWPFLLHMTLTFSPLYLFPELCFSHPPYALTLLGQYIVKNLILIMAGVTVFQTQNRHNL